MRVEQSNSKASPEEGMMGPPAFVEKGDTVDVLISSVSASADGLTVIYTITD